MIQQVHPQQTTRQAHWIRTVPDGAGEQSFYEVGNPYRVLNRSKGRYEDVGIYDRIEITNDLPGPNSWLERARVYVGDNIVAELIVHNCEGVGYELPVGTEIEAMGV